MSRGTQKRIIVGAAIAALIAVFAMLDLEDYLTLEYIRGSQGRYAALYEEHRLPIIGGYMVIYIMVTGLSLPGAAVMTLAGGALFGFWVGTIVVSFASTIGATAACLAARYLLRGWVQRAFADTIARVNRGVEKEGAFYLFALRLVPVFPFWMINLAMGLTTMRIRTFCWVSQVGMLAGTMVYVNAGRVLAGVESPGEILSPRLIGAFVVLGLFPLAVRRLMVLLRRALGKGTTQAD